MPCVRSRYSAAIVPIAACRPALGSGSDIGISVGAAAGWSGRGGDAGEGVDQRAVGELVALRAGLAVAVIAIATMPRVELAQPGVVEAHPVERAGAHVVDHDVRAGQQAAEHGAALAVVGSRQTLRLPWLNWLK